MHTVHEDNIEVFISEVTVNDFIVDEYTLRTDKCASACVRTCAHVYTFGRNARLNADKSSRRATPGQLDDFDLVMRLCLLVILSPRLHRDQHSRVDLGSNARLNSDKSPCRRAKSQRIEVW
ncbi:hypothetical protein DPMN_186911 [Dreissena polymorpha]|uniref:Uncharacterized protein n=1 Tax=Dreissena polymorpha TaxID=45954 RepID=A0A9D4DPJ0_DREPO|nr:hypothetical protein DPMN_186911 [Dreissena polymorpha]